MRWQIDRRIVTSTLVSMALLGCAGDDANSSVWLSHCEPLQGGEYQACYGPGWNKGVPRDEAHFSFYEVAVEKPKGDRSFTMLFDKKFAPAEVLPRLLTRETANVVKFDDASKLVTFAVGRKPIYYFINADNPAGGENAQDVTFTGPDTVFRVVATATAHVTVDQPFMQLRLDQGTIRSTALAIGPQHIIGYRINLAAASASGGWSTPRKSELVPLDVVLDPLATTSLVSRTLTIPIDGIDTLQDKWLVFEVDVDVTPPTVTYSHSQRLTVHE